ncbi:MAG: FIST N-terminal domain-containing protein [Candidatus Omnitrophota bacterium]
MATHVGIGFSQKFNSAEAVSEAASQAKALTKQPKVDLVIVFHTIHYNPAEFLPILRQIFKESKILGSSTAGLITSNFTAMHGMLIVAVCSDDTHFAVDAIECPGFRNMREAGSTLAKSIIKDYGQHRRQAFLYFTDGLLNDHSQVLEGLRDVLGNIFPIAGAGSSDDFHFQRTYQLCEDRILSQAIAGLLLGGHLTISLGSRHGWKPLGKPRFVDQAEGNIIKSIDGKPAASIYTEYFGKEAESLLSTQLGQIAILYPLGFYIPGENEHLLRTVINIRNDGSIICQDQIPEHSEVHLMITNKEACIQAAAEAALEAQNGLLGKEAKLIIIFESLTRQKLLGRNAFQEIKALKGILGHATPIAGMYSYGEIYPSKATGETGKIHLRNENITIIAIG